MVRRHFLRAAVLGGAGMALLGPGAVADPSSTGQSHRRRHPRTIVAFRLSTRGQQTCSACKGHAAHRYYATKGAADNDRAHLGCNCKIVEHPLPARRYWHYFGSPQHPKRRVFDDRWRKHPRDGGPA